MSEEHKEEVYESDTSARMSEINANNYKLTHAAFEGHVLAAASRSQTTFDQIQARLISSMDEALGLQKKVNQSFIDSKEDTRRFQTTQAADRARYADDAEYVTRYDLSNPVTTGTGDAVRAAAGVSADAVAAAVAKQVDATITPVLATLQQMVQALTTATTSIANVVNQAQPKTA